MGAAWLTKCSCKDGFELGHEHAFGRLGVERQSSPLGYSFMALDLSSAESKTTAEQANVEGEQTDKKEEVFSSYVHQERFCKSFGENTVPQEKPKAGATSTSAALPEDVGSPAPLFQHPHPREAQLGNLLATRKNNARQAAAAKNSGQAAPEQCKHLLAGSTG